jgi:alginate O-acetyltransferase complex protein AlgI
VSEAISPLIGTIQFASISFLGFLAATAIVYYLLPGPRTRTALLLAVSSVFYILLSPRHFGVLFVVTAVAYVTGLLLDRQADEPRVHYRRGILLTALLVLIGGLAVFKYSTYLMQIVSRVIPLGGLADSMPVLRLALPLGMSFWTFQTIAYVVDVYKKKTAAERNPFYFWLSVMFFPVVTAGPITKVQSLTTQFRSKHRFDYGGMQSGLLLVGRGFFKKLIIADRLAVFVDSVFNSPRSYVWNVNGLILFIAACFFAVQLYMDFSAYTDIVRGSARLFGVELPINFRAPYFARSVQEFWRRWHISLMDWLKEYVYIPLGGNRVGTAHGYVNLLIVFAVSGLWHGTGVTYLAWGLLNGFYQVAGQMLAPARDKVVSLLRIDRETFGHRVFQTMFTFVLITVAWVFFRANSMADALYIASNMFAPTTWVLADGSLLKLGVSAAELGIALGSAGIIFGAEWLSLRKDLLVALRGQHIAYRWVAYYVLILSVVIFGAYGGVYNAADFVYFKF